jgi:hypothetical protein
MKNFQFWLRGTIRKSPLQFTLRPLSRNWCYSHATHWIISTECGIFRDNGRDKGNILLLWNGWSFPLLDKPFKNSKCPDNQHSRLQNKMKPWTRARGIMEKTLIVHTIGLEQHANHQVDHTMQNVAWKKWKGKSRHSTPVNRRPKGTLTCLTRIWTTTAQPFRSDEHLNSVDFESVFSVLWWIAGGGICSQMNRDQVRSKKWSNLERPSFL